MPTLQLCLVYLSAHLIRDINLLGKGKRVRVKGSFPFTFHLSLNGLVKYAIPDVQHLIKSLSYWS
jgi:hypothetical protein